jgi:hypothetical protein
MTGKQIYDINNNTLKHEAFSATIPAQTRIVYNTAVLPYLEHN